MTRTSRSANCITSRCYSTSRVPCPCSRIGTLDVGTASVKAPPTDGEVPLGWVGMGGCPEMLRSCQLDERDLGRRAQPERWPPVSGAPADIEPHRLEAVQAGDEGLKQPHQQIEGEILTAVRMSGDLEVIAGGACGKRALRLVREQHLHVALGRLGNRPGGIGAMT